jgi:hypothetical protein
MSSYQPGRIDTQVLSLAAPKKLGGEKQGWPGRAGAESHERGLPNPTAFEATPADVDPNGAGGRDYDFVR